MAESGEYSGLTAPERAITVARGTGAVGGVTLVKRLFLGGPAHGQVFLVNPLLRMIEVSVPTMVPVLDAEGYSVMGPAHLTVAYRRITGFSISPVYTPSEMPYTDVRMELMRFMEKMLEEWIRAQ
jgi:hypothetical protein